MVLMNLLNYIDGPFKDLEGVISETDTVHGKSVLVSLFGHETPVEVFLQIKSYSTINSLGFQLHRLDTLLPRCK